MKIKLVTASILLLVSSAMAAESKSVGAPEHHIGDVHQFSYEDKNNTCTQWEVIEIDAKDVVTGCEDFRQYRARDHDLNFTRIEDKDGTLEVEYRPYYPELSFPLKVGKKWSGAYDTFIRAEGAVWHGNMTCSVNAHADVTVPAGTFKAFSIDCVEEITWNARKSVAHSRHWYAPTAKAIVKVVVSEDPRRNYELIHFKLK